MGCAIGMAHVVSWLDLVGRDGQRQAEIDALQRLGEAERSRSGVGGVAVHDQQRADLPGSHVLHQVGERRRRLLCWRGNRRDELQGAPARAKLLVDRVHERVRFGGTGLAQHAPARGDDLQ